MTRPGLASAAGQVSYAPAACTVPSVAHPHLPSLIWRLLIKYFVPLVLGILLIQIFKKDVVDPYEVSSDLYRRAPMTWLFVAPSHSTVTWLYGPTNKHPIVSVRPWNVLPLILRAPSQ